MSKNTLPSVVFRLKGTYYGISSKYVVELIRMPDIVKMPSVKPWMSGVINVRDKVFPLIDMRILLGMDRLDSQIEELVETLKLREQDHINWLAELERCLEENDEFRLATDPHKCAFGKWYDAYDCHELELCSQLRKFEAPHARIHAIAEEVIALRDQGQLEEARQRVENTRDGDLAAMRRLFGETYDELLQNNNEVAMLMQVGEHSFAISVDGVTAVEHLIEYSEGADHVSSSAGEEARIVEKFVKNKNDNMVMSISPAKLMEMLGKELEKAPA